MAEEQVAEPSQEASPSDDWKSSLDPTYASDPSLQHIGSFDALAKSYINAQKMVGAEKVAIPGSWATEEDWNGIYNKLGRPEAPDKYELELGENANADFSDWFKNTAHGVGLSTQQAQKLATAYGEFTGSAQQVTDEQIESRRAEVETELRKELGTNYDDKLQSANTMLQELDAPDLTEIALADGSLLGDNPELIKMMVRLNDYVKEQLGEDALAGRESRPGVSAEDLQNRISELTQADSPYWTKMHPDHDRVVAEALRLREQLNG